MILTPSGKVSYANATARTIFPAEIGETLNDEWLSRQISAVRLGYANLPATSMMEIPVENDAPDIIQITLLSSPVGDDLIVLAKNNSEENAYTNVVSNLAEMLDCEYQAPMQNFLASVSKMIALFEANTNENWYLRESVTSVTEMGRNLAATLHQIGLLAATFKKSQMRGSERILVNQMIADVLGQTARVMQERRVRVSFTGFVDDSPVIYGSKFFLTHALAGYLRHLVQQIDQGSNILLSLKGKAGFLLLCIANDGQGHYPAKRKHVTQPFLDAPVEDDGLPAAELSLPLCERVVELHGGNLSISFDGNELNQIIFELPTGAPAEQSDEQGVKQAQRYAQDLLKLIHNNGANHNQQMQGVAK